MFVDEWFTSDPHFQHRNIINFCNRPFQDLNEPMDSRDRWLVDEMDEHLIQEWNKVVKPQDNVRLLGDAFYTGTFKRAVEIRMALNGRIHFIEGNHDEHAYNMHHGNCHLGYPAWTKARFESWNRLDEVTINGQTIVLCHFALREWHLYGHTHASLRPFGKSVDVGIDNVQEIVPGAPMRPLHFDEIKVFMDKQEIGPHPKFENYYPGHPELEKTSIL